MKTGEAHPKAVYTDHEVELIRQLHEDEGWTLRQLREKFGGTLNALWKICTYRTRVVHLPNGD